MLESFKKVIINNNSIDIHEYNSDDKYVRYVSKEIDDTLIKHAISTIIYHTKDFKEFGELRDCYMIYPSCDDAAGMLFYGEKIIYQNV